MLIDDSEIKKRLDKIEQEIEFNIDYREAEEQHRDRSLIFGTGFIIGVVFIMLCYILSIILRYFI